MDLRTTQLKDTYGNLVTTGTTEGNPTSGGLQNGQGTLLTAVGIGTNSPSRLLSVVSSTSASVMQISNSTAGTDADRGLEFFLSGTTAGIVNRENGSLDFRTNNDVKLLIEADGDIAFYDDANNQGLFWDASAGSLGIGTTSIRGKLDIKNSNAGFEFFPENSTDTNLIINFDRTTSTYQNLQIRAATHQFLIDASEKMRIDSSGNVGIGTTSPSSYGKTTIALGAVAGNVLALQKDSGAGIAFYGASFNATGLLESQSTSGDMVFYTGTSGLTEKMRIDSSGNVTIKGSDSTTYEALKLQNTHGSAANQGKTQLEFSVLNSISTDVRSTIVSEERTSDSNLSNLIFSISDNSSGNPAEAFRLTGGTSAGDTTFLRMASGTGGIQFNGDTASANALDDYEEGTFDATIYEVGGSDILVEPDANYVKIGSLVHIQVRALGGTTGTSGVVRMNLPFTNTSKGGANIVAYTAANGSIVSVFCIDGTNYVEFVDTIGTIAAGNKSIGSDWGASSRLYFNFTYSTT